MGEFLIKDTKRQQKERIKTFQEKKVYFMAYDSVIKCQ